MSFRCDKSKNVLNAPRVSPANNCCFLFYFLLCALMMSVPFSWENAAIIVNPKQCIINMQLNWPQNKIENICNNLWIIYLSWILFLEMKPWEDLDTREFKVNIIWQKKGKKKGKIWEFYVVVLKWSYRLDPWLTKDRPEIYFSKLVRPPLFGGRPKEWLWEGLRCLWKMFLPPLQQIDREPRWFPKG